MGGKESVPVSLERHNGKIIYIKSRITNLSFCVQRSLKYCRYVLYLIKNPKIHGAGIFQSLSAHDRSLPVGMNS